MKTKPVSIIVLCHNHWDTTQRCLESLRRSTPARLFEVLAFDNASTDETPAKLRDLSLRWPALKYFRNESNLPFAEAVNRGMSKAAGRYLLWLNNDTVVASGWLQGLLAAIESDPAVAAAGPMTDTMAPPQQLSRPFKTRQGAGLVETPFLGGFCFLLKRTAFEHAGPLDESFHWGWEDIDYCLRLRQSGRKLVVARGVFVRHLGNRTIKTMPSAERRKTDRNNRALISLKWKHAQPWRNEVRGLLEWSTAPWVRPAPKISIFLIGDSPSRLERMKRKLRPRLPKNSYEVLPLDFSASGLWNKTPLALALNRAVARSQSETVAILDDHTLPRKEWLTPLESNRVRYLGRHGPDHRLVIPRAIFDRLGGFDERLSGTLSAVDFCRRAAQAGFELSRAEAGSQTAPDGSAATSSSPRDRNLAASKWLDCAFRPAISAILLCGGDEEVDRRRLESLRHRAGDLAYEVLAVQPAGADSRWLEVFASDWPQMRVLTTPVSMVPPRALNWVSHAALGESLLFLSDVLAASPRFLESLASVTRSAPFAGIVAPSCAGADLSWQRSLAVPRKPRLRVVDHVRDYCVLIPRTVFSAVGELDDRLSDGLWVADYCLRARQRGYQVLVADNALVRRVPARLPSDDSRAGMKALFEKWAGHPLFRLELAG